MFMIKQSLCLVAGVLGLFLALSWIFVSLRVYVKAFLKKSWGMDDYLLIISLVSCHKLSQLSIAPTWSRFINIYELDILFHILCLRCYGYTLWNRPTHDRYPKTRHSQSNLLLVPLRTLLYHHNSVHPPLHCRLPSPNLYQAYPQVHSMGHACDGHRFLDILSISSSSSNAVQSAFSGASLRGWRDLV